ncbi:hypothetical protein JX266_003717 [Neoarthrinium moseri]|uniref:uncharacterized protein n=1 Tax=Neoarthrinium moseri TaxID=1658444 RepID=UPI001FDBE7A5|nr:uncharacterized protein JN550_008096 [Neoarthrinium moseri]KAI1851052.1 hypothetical protein JX266_003717 [Neoarthrinium moseri]KAI1865838.1 hypothetical protein JN550_008096 [Neoarthrinium moseri]
MFYKPGETHHGLPHDPFKACVIPRPIGWISTVSTSGEHNLAPFSQFNNLTFDPPLVMFSSNQTIDNTRKDTVNNVESTGVFCWQLATYSLREAVNITSEALEPSIDEFEKAGLKKTWSQTLKTPVPMVEASPVRFECEYVQTIRLPGNPPAGTVDLVIGRVVGVHIDEAVLTDGKIDVRKTKPIARLGYYDYGVIEDSFEMIIPGDKRILYGLEGNAQMNREEHERQKKSQEKGQET